jgi:hypothetical protein
MSNKPMCVLCHVPLYKSEKEEFQWICSKDRSHKYQLYQEVMAYDEDFSTVYGEEEENELELEGLGQDSAGLLVADNEFEIEEDEEDKHKDPGSIPIPKYMKGSATTEVIEYREE